MSEIIFFGCTLAKTLSKDLLKALCYNIMIIFVCILAVIRLKTNKYIGI